MTFDRMLSMYFVFNCGRNGAEELSLEESLYQRSLAEQSTLLEMQRREELGAYYRMSMQQEEGRLRQQRQQDLQHKQSMAAAVINNRVFNRSREAV